VAGDFCERYGDLLAGWFDWVDRIVRAWGQADGVPVIYGKAGERKHLIAEGYLAADAVALGVFVVLVARAAVWTVSGRPPFRGAGHA
jgi:hypothetical protein